jgi:hypothetical protein
MGRLDLRDVYRDEDADARVRSWKQSYDNGTADARCDEVLAKVRAGTWIRPTRKRRQRMRQAA